MTKHKIVAETPYNTVISEYTPAEQTSTAYQSENDLEKEFIALLSSQGYQHLQINNEQALIHNLRQQLEKLNDYHFSAQEWQNFFEKYLANANLTLADKTKLLQEICILNLTKDDGYTKNIKLIDKENIHNNTLQVINQYVQNSGPHKARYDVTILLNGFPIVHIELKRRGVALREAFNQITRYEHESFWASSGLFQYVQIFVISNGTHTKYYSNSTRDSHIHEQSKHQSFQFTSFWADANNNLIPDLVDFTKTFFAKHTLLNILTKFCVFTHEHELLVLRPYQITATERILQRIELAHNQKLAGTKQGGGYIWHTTGSGKTLTSFKTAQLATQLPYVYKVFFIVDRKDLDNQTVLEYDRYEKGSVNSNNSVKALTKQIDNPQTRIIVTTIQKLAIFIKNNSKHFVFKKRVVLIFDECHRSQFGDLHKSIVKAFSNYNLFGFTGTPIFAANANNATEQTTEQVFGDKLHTYTIVNAIQDENVLPFRIDYIKTVKRSKNESTIKQKLNTKAIFDSPQRIEKIVQYILEHFDQKTKRNHFSLEKTSVKGFNSILAVSSIPMAIAYYQEFKKQLQESQRPLKIATIFSANSNQLNTEDSIPDESFDTNNLDQTSRDFLNRAIADYDQMFKTNFACNADSSETSSDTFESYYRDLSDKLKKRQIDLVIVVNMFLTGFDAPTLNTLWVDKNLQYHSLIQAFSRTNRIFNSVKTFGNIICFRDLQQETDQAIALFGDQDAGGIILLKTYREYYDGYDSTTSLGTVVHHQGYKELIAILRNKFPIKQEIVGEKDKIDFIQLFGKILKIRNILQSFDEFKKHEIINERKWQDYISKYLDLYQDLYQKNQQNVHDNSALQIDNLEFEIELIRQIDVNIDYILMLVEKYRASRNSKQTILINIEKALKASFNLRSRKDLIMDFIQEVKPTSSVSDDWQRYVNRKKDEEMHQLIEEEHLEPELTPVYLQKSFQRGEMKTIGTDLQEILPPLDLFAKDSQQKNQNIIVKIKEFFNKYLGLVS